MMIKAQFFDHLSGRFFGNPVTDVDRSRFKCSREARFRMEDFLPNAAGLDYDKPEGISLFLCRFQSEQVLRLQLHRKYLLLPNPLVTQERWIDPERFKYCVVSFLEGDARPNKGGWSIEEVFRANNVQHALRRHERGLRRYSQSCLEELNTKVETKIIELFWKGLMPGPGFCSSDVRRGGEVGWWCAGLYHIIM